MSARERPILFKGRLVRAILERKKTQTRRIFKSPARKDSAKLLPELLAEMGVGAACPYGAPGDRLWVRESFCIETSVDGDQQLLPHNDGRPVKRDVYGDWSQPHYAATDQRPDLECDHQKHQGAPCPRPWKPSIHMPRWASRIDLEISGVRVEPLQAITEEDAVAEGAVASSARWWKYFDRETTGCFDTCTDADAKPPHEGDERYQLLASRVESESARDRFSRLWDSINADRGFSWAANPWVWAISFKPVAR